MSRIIPAGLLVSAIISIIVAFSGCVSTQSVLVEVISVIDGDTIRVQYDYDNDGLLDKVSIRYIGIDTPEIHQGSKPVGEFGEEALEYNRTLIELSDYQVKLEVQGRDNYDRILAYAYSKNGEFINEKIMEKGLARPLTYEETSKYSEQLKDAYYYAFDNRKGIFSKYDTVTIDASVVTNDLENYLGKVTWIKFVVAHSDENELLSKYALVEIREEEKNLFFSGDTDFKNYVGKTVKVFGEIWEENNRAKILLRAPFELKIIN